MSTATAGNSRFFLICPRKERLNLTKHQGEVNRAQAPGPLCGGPASAQSDTPQTYHRRHEDKQRKAAEQDHPDQVEILLHVQFHRVPVQHRKNAHMEYRIVRPITTAVRNSSAFTRNTPALSTNILKGMGGGGMLGITTVRSPYFLKSLSARSMFSCENLRLSIGLPPLRPRV